MRELLRYGADPNERGQVTHVVFINLSIINLKLSEHFTMKHQADDIPMTSFSNSKVTISPLPHFKLAFIFLGFRNIPVVSIAEKLEDCSSLVFRQCHTELPLVTDRNLTSYPQRNARIL